MRPPPDAGEHVLASLARKQGIMRRIRHVFILITVAIAAISSAAAALRLPLQGAPGGTWPGRRLRISGSRSRWAGAAASLAGKRGRAGLAITAVVLAALLSGCGTRLAHGSMGAPRPRPGHGVLAAAAGTVSGHQPRQHRAVFHTTRTLWLGAGRATRTFTLRERSGVILRNQLTIRHGVRAYVDARIPGVAGVGVWSWASRHRPSASCQRDGAFDVCAQGEEWCPMPQATWHLRLVKVGGPAGPIRVDFVVAAPPGTAG